LPIALYVAGRRDACLLVGFLLPVVWLPFLIAVVLAPTATAALLLFVPVSFSTTAFNAVGPAALMQITPQRMRGQAGALYLFLINLVGLGLGPTAVALCTDYLFHDDGMVGYSLMTVEAVALPLSAVVLWYGRRHFIRTLDAAARWSEAKAA
jgi:MFS family permease